MHSAWLMILAQQVAITNVHVIPMDGERVLRDQVVVVRDGRIERVGGRAPAGARVIDGGGGYLLPGLSDLHVHMKERADLGDYLCSGVTTIANLGGANGAQLRAWRDSIRAGRMIGPELLVGYFIDGPGTRGGVADVAEAVRAVRAADSLGYDFMKAYNSLTAEQFNAIAGEAKRRRLSLIGHGVRSVGLEGGFAAGQSMVVHAEEYIYADLRGRADTSQIARAVEFTRRSGAYVLPNLSAFEAMTRQWGRPEIVEEYLARPEARYMSPSWTSAWRESDYARRRGSIAGNYAFLRQLTGALHRGGVPLLTGTDSPGIPGMYAGFSLHDDLRLLVEVGLTPYEAIAASTRNAGEFARKHFRAPDQFGVIKPGYRADFILVAENPLENIARLRTIRGVMVRGQWLDAGALERLRSERD